MDEAARVRLEFRLLMAALILAVRTARFEEAEFEGMGTPRVAGQIGASLWMANKLAQRAEGSYPEWFKG